LLLLFALILILISLWLLRLAARQQQATGLPGGRVIASDTRSWKPLQEALYHPLLHLSGKPDYLVQHGRHVIPIEAKSASGLYGPCEGHIFQLAAYCLLVEHTFGTRPPYGILHYMDRTYQIEFTPELEKSLRHLLAEMRAKEQLGELPRSHTSGNRCAACGFRHLCDQRLSNSD